MLNSIGFIGTGNMATAIANGICNGGALPPGALYAYDVNADALNRFCTASGAHACASATELVQAVDCVVLAVKPQNIDDVLAEIKGNVPERVVFVSILAGMTSAYIKEYLGFDAKVIPVMPNTPLLLGCGAVAMCKTAPVSDAEYAFVRNVFEQSGTVCDIPEEKLKEIIAINGSSPAFIYLFAKGFIDYAKREEIDSQTALTLFCKSLEGSAKMMVESGYSIDELIKMVSSPGGTTLAGLDAFYDAELCKTIQDACDRCTKRAYELSK